MKPRRRPVPPASRAASWVLLELAEAACELGLSSCPMPCWPELEGTRAVASMLTCTMILIVRRVVSGGREDEILVIELRSGQGVVSVLQRPRRFNFGVERLLRLRALA